MAFALTITVGVAGKKVFAAMLAELAHDVKRHA